MISTTIIEEPRVSAKTKRISFSDNKVLYVQRREGKVLWPPEIFFSPFLSRPLIVCMKMKMVTSFKGNNKERVKTISDE